MNWLTTETKPVLQRIEEPPPAPPKVGEFALVLGFILETDLRRLARAVCRINHCSQAAALWLLQKTLPAVINLDLTEEEAALGQFELVCCGAISAVVRSEVAAHADHAYLAEVLERVSQSPEFRPAVVRVKSVPRGEEGDQFLDQFVAMNVKSLRRKGFPQRYTMPAKKARAMKEWAARIGAEVHDYPDFGDGNPEN